MKNKPPTKEEIIEKTKDLSAEQLMWKRQAREQQYRRLKFHLFIGVVIAIFLALYAMDFVKKGNAVRMEG